MKERNVTSLYSIDFRNRIDIIRICALLLLIYFVLALNQSLYAQSDGTVVKKVLDVRDAGKNLLKQNAWRPWQKGFERQGNIFICDNGNDAQSQRGVSQTVVLNQRKPEPIIATAWSKAEAITGSRNSDYSLYLDLVYSDGSSLWGQTDSF
ncbi:MAG: hypothetical protein ACYS6K_19535, partial [Planctomycetota bacterium]